MIITLNLTQHAATPEQISAGVFDPTPQQKEEIVKLLTFEDLPRYDEIKERAYDLAIMAYTILQEKTGDDDRTVDDKLRYGTSFNAMIGGAPYLMSALEDELTKQMIVPVYAFSVRDSVEKVQPDGSVKKVATFRHAGFISPYFS